MALVQPEDTKTSVQEAEPGVSRSSEAAMTVAQPKGANTLFEGKITNALVQIEAYFAPLLAHTDVYWDMLHATVRWSTRLQ